MARKLIVWTLKALKECIEKMTHKDKKYDCIVFIEGARGNGKSTLAYKILSGLNVEHPFNIRRDLVYSREETLKLLANYQNGCIMSDEMIAVAYKRDFYNEDQKELLKALDCYRDSRNVFIGCIPNFIDLDVKIQKVCKIRITVVRRGIALIQLQNHSIYSNDPWDIKNNQKIESKWALRGIAKPRYSQLTTVRGILYFGDLSPAQREEYDKIKAEKRSHVFAKYQDEALIHDPEKLFLNKTIEMLKAGKFTPESFDMVCQINTKNPESLRKEINKRLTEEGDLKRWKDYCMTDRRKAKRDRIGFDIKEPPKTFEEVAKMPASVEPRLPVADNKEYAPKIEPNEDLDTDDLGFAS